MKRILAVFLVGSCLLPLLWIWFVPMAPRPTKPGVYAANMAQADEGTPVPLPTPRPISADSLFGDDGDVVVTGKVIPQQEAGLSFTVNGVVSEVLVKEGERVQAGQPLLRLDSSQQEAAIAQAEASLSRTTARLIELQRGALPQEIQAAEASLAAAEATLEEVRQGPPPEQVAVAQAELANLEASLRLAQSAYDQIAWRNDIGATSEAVQLEQATNNYNLGLTRLQAVQTVSPATLAAASANVRFQQAQVELIKMGPRPEAITMARADMTLAEIALEQAQAALEETVLVAPFDGTIAFLEVSVGEQIIAGEPLIQLADLSSWIVETQDITEYEIVHIEPNTPAVIQFDAIRGFETQGSVTHIRPVGESRNGEVIFTVVVDPFQQHEKLFWNMTAEITFQFDQ